MIPLGILASSVRRASAALLAPTNLVASLIGGSVKLTWTDRNTNETGHRIYRSSSPMDTQALPPPVAEIGPDVTEWEDTNTPEDQVIYYIVSAVRGVDEAFSDEVVIDTTSTEGDPYWDNVVALLHFDGDFVDQRGNTMSAVGTAGFGPGKFGSAMTLTSGDSGTSQPTNTSTLDLPADFTIEGWVKPDAGSSGAFVNRFEVSSIGAGWQIYMSTSGRLSFYQYLNGGSYPIGDAGPDLRDGNWHHVAVSRQGSALRMFVDGVLVGTGTSSTNYTSTTARLSIGYQVQGSASYPMRGSIDEVRITEGVARYTENFTPPTGPFPNQ